MIAFLTILLAAAGTAVGLRQTGRVRMLVLMLCGAGLLVVTLLLPVGLALDKLIARLLMPAGFLWLLICGWAWWSLVRGRHRSAFGATILGVVVWFAGAPIVGDRLLARLEAPFRSLRPLDGPNFDAVIVLGGGTRFVQGRARLDIAGDRVFLGAQLQDCVPSGPGFEEVHRACWEILGRAVGR